jgi:hypothetical protein
MRRFVLWYFLFLTLAVGAPAALAQYELIMIERPFQARHLAGVVVDSTGAPVAGVVIEDCVQTFRKVRAPGDTETPVFEERMILDCHFESKHVLASTRTDSEGRFKFPHATMGSTHYLYLSQSGFDPMQIAVKLRFFACAEMRVKLVIAT